MGFLCCQYPFKYNEAFTSRSLNRYLPRLHIGCDGQSCFPFEALLLLRPYGSPYQRDPDGIWGRQLEPEALEVYVTQHVKQTTEKRGGILRLGQLETVKSTEAGAFLTDMLCLRCSQWPFSLLSVFVNFDHAEQVLLLLLLATTTRRSPLACLQNVWLHVDSKFVLRFPHKVVSSSGSDSSCRHREFSHLRCPRVNLPSCATKRDI